MRDVDARHSIPGVGHWAFIKRDTGRNPTLRGREPSRRGRICVRAVIDLTGRGETETSFLIGRCDC